MERGDALAPCHTFQLCHVRVHVSVCSVHASVCVSMHVSEHTCASESACVCAREHVVSVRVCACEGECACERACEHAHTHIYVCTHRHTRSVPKAGVHFFFVVALGTRCSQGSPSPGQPLSSLQTSLQGHSGDRTSPGPSLPGGLGGVPSARPVLLGVPLGLLQRRISTALCLPLPRRSGLQFHAEPLLGAWGAGAAALTVGRL